MEVVGWDTLLNRVLAAATSGQGPDVLNIGNAWSASLPATGALLPFDDSTMDAVGGPGRFLAGSLAATGAPSEPPTAVPLYTKAYVLYYNKMFADAGISQAPVTWTELVADGRKLTHDGRLGLAVEGANVSENAHHAFTFAQQYGANFFDAALVGTRDEGPLRRRGQWQGNHRRRHPAKLSAANQQVKVGG
jgi:multiple sugar transport system substrate-binding protein